MNFDEWRAAYDQMSYQDHLAFYDDVWSSYPVQCHFDARSASTFFREIMPEEQKAKVAEVGGWRGELADIILHQQPGISSWHNVEICRGAVRDAVCLDHRYSAEVPKDWVWTLPVDQESTILVLSHVIEHMRMAEAAKLFARYPSARYVFVASPLDDEPRSWEGYSGSHILETGWNGVVAMLSAFQLHELPSYRTVEVRCFRRRE